MPPADSPNARSPRRFFVFALVTVLFSLVLALAAAEWWLDHLNGKIARSERMDPGLIHYDPRLGWRLAPGWRGSHRHHDFSVEYRINDRGFRGTDREAGSAARVVVLGDSFTFGLGVADEETFVARMNALSDGRRFINLGVPGYSTDQEYLLYGQLAARLAPQAVLLVVYLGNDLFDNLLSYPLQADHAKPYFTLRDGELVLMNTPVPKRSKPARARQQELAAIVLGDARPEAPLLTRTLGRLAISRSAGLFQQQVQLPDAFFEARFRPAIHLFLALVEAMDAELPGVAFRVALLPGRSLVQAPDSLSGQYQDYLRRVLVSRLDAMPGVEVIDVAAAMQGEAGREAWYFPHEGHLTAAGHAFVARTLLQAFAD